MNQITAMTASCAAHVLFICVLIVSLGASYQKPSQELLVCAQDNADSTLHSFWNEVNGHCDKDPHKLIELYKNIVRKGNRDKCNVLLSNQLRKSLLDTTALILEEAFLTNAFRQNSEIESLVKEVYQCDPLLSQALLERFIDAVYLFVDRKELATLLFEHKFFEQMVTSLLHLQWRLTTRGDNDPDLSHKMALYLKRMKEHKELKSLSRQLQRRIDKTIHALPFGLLNFYFTKDVRLINTGHWEYLYAPRYKGPDDYRRTPLTWISEKNGTDSTAYLTLQIEENDNGTKVAFGSNYDGDVRFLFVDEQRRQPFFWLGDELQASMWWKARWYDDYFTFENVVTKHLLCATIEYNGSRRYVTVQHTSSLIEPDPDCRWTIWPSK